MEFKSKALVLKLNGVANSKASSVDIWLPTAERDLGVEELLPALQDRPSWVQGPERVRTCGQEIQLHRTNLPPSIHFGRVSVTRVTSIFAATMDDNDHSNGFWVPSVQLLQQVEEQWRSILHGLCSQYKHAVAAGYLTQKSSAEQASGSRSTKPSHQPSNPQNIQTITSRAREPADPPTSGTERVFDLPSGPSCFGYDQPSHAWGMSTELTGGRGEGNEEEGSQHSDAERLEEQEPPSSEQEPVMWKSGMVAIIKQGGRDVQSVLDAEGVKLGIVNWHSSWIEACLEIQPYMQRLAARFKSVAIMELDVEHSMANKLFSYEKVLTRSESRRKGAKPVVRDNKQFPCLTVHDPSNPLPRQMFCGKDALDELAVGALVARTKELTEAPQLRSSQPKKSDEVDDAQDSTLLDTEKAANPPQSNGHEPGTASKPGDVSSAEVEQGKPQNLKVIKRGAMELRQHLYQAKQTNQRVAILWTSGTAGSSDFLQDCAAARPGDTFLLADVTAGKDNRQLAASLKVKHFPTVQVYLNLKLVKHIDQKAAAKGLGHALSLALANMDTNPTPAPQQQDQAATSSALKSPEGSAVDDAVKGKAEQRAVMPSGEAENSKAELSGGIYDPPKQTSKAEQKRKFPAGTGIYWPKMPCLQCGCPWWLGEDWDARCARCQWTAESDGYDDDSKPLPKFKAKYEEFTAMIKAGRTQEWQS